jgi:hypothetical protein
MNILVSGCSFTAEDWSWASHFESKNHYVSNLAHHGAGNTYIRRQIQKEFFHKERLNIDLDYDFAIIQWSTIDRWEYPFIITSENDSPIIKFQHQSGEDVIGKVAYNRNGTSFQGKCGTFYETFYSKYGQLINTLDDIYYTQLFLEQLGIPYIMFSIANFLTTEVSFDMIKNIKSIKGDLQKQRTDKLEIESLLKFCETTDTIKILKERIDWDKFVWTSDFKIDGIGDGFTEYLINKGEPFKYNGNHPDEKQHLDFFNDVIYPEFQSKIKII